MKFNGTHDFMLSVIIIQCRIIIRNNLKIVNYDHDRMTAKRELLFYLSSVGTGLSFRVARHSCRMMC